MTINELITKLENIRENCSARGETQVEAIIMDPSMVIRGCELQPFFDANMARISIYTPDSISLIEDVRKRKEEEND